MQKNAHIPTPTPNTRDRALNVIKRTYDNAYHDWEHSDLHEWLVVGHLAYAISLVDHQTYHLTPLQDHGIAPKPKSTREELVDQVNSAWGTANSYLGTGSNQAQKAYNQASKDASSTYKYYADKFNRASSQIGNNNAAHSGKGRFPPSKAIVDSWSESDLREFLLKNNIISPSSKTEELRILATKKLDELAHLTASTKDQAVESVVDAAHYAVYDAPKIAYDYVHGALDGKLPLFLPLMAIS